jgi:hypothetical protein
VISAVRVSLSLEAVVVTLKSPVLQRKYKESSSSQIDSRDFPATTSNKYIIKSSIPDVYSKRHKIMGKAKEDGSVGEAKPVSKSKLNQI